MGAVWNGADPLRPLLRPLSDLHTHPRNPRKGDIGEIAKSLERFGQVRAVLAQADGTIVAGNHTFLAAESLGWTHVAVVAHAFKDEAEARDYLLADNRLADVGEYERAELVLLLGELEESGRWDGTGYEPDDLAHFRDLEKIAIAPTPDPATLTAPPPQTLREVVLLYAEEDLNVLSERLRGLRDRYGTEGVVETILVAVKREALRVHQGIEAT